MVSTPEQRRRYRERYPEKVKEQRRRYLEKRIRENPELIKKASDKLRNDFNRLTRILYDDILPRECAVCGTNEDLQIHHKVYEFPIKEEHLVRFCRRHHIEEHQKMPIVNCEK